MVTVTIVGASGYLGGELIRILANHPNVDEIIPISRRYAGRPVSSLHRNLKKIFDKNFIDLNLGDIESDVVFFATPPGDWFGSIPEILDRGIKVITLGGKFRIGDSRIDEEVYGGYKNEELLKERIYGLPEIYRDAIKKARFVTNPGCYPTPVILGISPLVKFSEKLDLDKIVIDAISGTSGAGGSPSELLHHPTVSGNLKPYNIEFHRHKPEMEFILKEIFGNELKTSFVPILADFPRGILTNITIFSDELDVDLREYYQKHYRNEFFVRILDDVPYVGNVRNSNFCDIAVFFDKNSGRILMISAIDNLIKGGSGQAVQNMNLMFGIDENAGLEIVGGCL